MLYRRPAGIPIPGMLAIHGQFGNIPLRSITFNGLVKSRWLSRSPDLGSLNSSTWSAQ